MVKGKKVPKYKFNYDIFKNKETILQKLTKPELIDAYQVLERKNLKLRKDVIFLIETADMFQTKLQSLRQNVKIFIK